MTFSAPTTEYLPVSKLSIDPEVQRALEKPRVDRIVKNYSPAALGTLIVSRREDGTHHVVDGQHRLHATIAVGREESSMLCLVHEGLSKADEAAMFRLYNNTKAVSPFDKFRVRVIEGDEVAVTLNNILVSHGWKVEQSKNSGSFAAPAALEQVYGGKLNGEGTTADICDTVIRVITESWGHDADGVRGELVKGIGLLFLRYNSRVDVPKLTAQLSNYAGGPRALSGAAKGLRNFRGGLLPEAVAEILVEMLNKGRRTNLLPEWRSRAA